jgi:hypothetical protein
MSWIKYLKEEEEKVEQQKKEETKGIIVDFFTTNPNPSIEEIKQFSEDIGMSKDELDLQIYSVLGSFISKSQEDLEKEVEEKEEE